MRLITKKFKAKHYDLNYNVQLESLHFLNDFNKHLWVIKFSIHQSLIFSIILFRFWFGLTMRVWLACFFWIQGIMNACRTLFRWTLFASFRCAALPKTRLMLRLFRFLPWFTSQLDTTFSSPARIAPSAQRLSMLLRQWPHFSASLFLFFNRKATKCSQWSQLHPSGWDQSIVARSKFNGTW